MRIVEVDIGNGKVAKVTRPDRLDFDDNLGGGVAYQLANFLSWILETSGSSLGTFLGGGLVGFLETIEPHLVEIYSPLIDGLLEMEGIPDYWKEFLEGIKSSEHEAGAAALNAVLGGAAGAVGGSILSAALAKVTYAVNRGIEGARPTPMEAHAILWRMEGYTELVSGYLQDLGWDKDLIDAFPDILRPRPDIGTLLAHMWRKEEPRLDVKRELMKRGFLPTDANKFIELSHTIPGPLDLVRFALREVWREDLRPELLEPDAPARYYKLMRQQGFERKFAEDYWASHWRLPSPGQGIEMFWRLDDFTVEDLKALLVRLDILPAYQDNLIKIAYTPLTRVDIRRMNATGQIPDEELARHYQNVGFSPDDAKLMAEFTIAYNAGDETEVTKTEILSGLRVGMLSPEDAETMLVAIGKSEGYAAYVVVLEEYKRVKALITERVRYIKTLYVNGELDHVGASLSLAELDMTGERIGRYIEEWDIARTAKIAKPSLARIEEWYKEDVIDETTARRELTKRRYQDYTIDWYIFDWDTQIVAAALKEAERAQKEQERIAKAKFRDDRMVALADLSVEIAYLKLQIAEMKLGIYYAEGAEEYAVIADQIADLWRDYWEADTDEERDAIEAQMDALLEERGLLDSAIAKIGENILIAKRDIAAKQLEKAEVPVVSE